MSLFSQPVQSLLVVAMAFGIQLHLVETSEAAKPLVKTKFDPDAEQVDMFEGVEKGKIEVTILPKDEHGGNVLVTNKLQEPITVKVPDGFVGVPMHAQFDDFGGGGGGAGGGMGGQGGGMQMMGGGMGMGMGMGGMGMGGMGMGGMGMFSIPPERTVRLPYDSVCLEHGKRTPHPRGNYKLFPVEKFTDDPTFQTLIKMVGTGKVDKQSAQAAAWKLSHDLTWEDVARIEYERVAAPNVPQFTPAQLLSAQNLVAAAEGIARSQENKAAETKPAVTEPVNRTSPRRKNRVR